MHKNKHYAARNLILFVLLALFVAIVCIVNNHAPSEYPSPSDSEYVIEHLVHQSDNLDFAESDTVVYKDDDTQADQFPNSYYALFINDTDRTVITAKNAHQRMYPASMTKMMTAIVVAEALEAGTVSLDDMVEIQTRYDLSSEGLAPSVLTPGCRISLKNLLYGLLIESNNYYALYLAEYVGGDVETFCGMMNAKAQSIGATNTHFVNPHGLDDPDHYSTAYDMYLIIKEVHEHQVLLDVDDLTTYTYSYYDTNNTEVDMESTTTNAFLSGDASLPAPYSIEAWKTGTTSGAGSCIAMYLTKDGKDYVVVASSGESRDDLYDSVVRLLCLTD